MELLTAEMARYNMKMSHVKRDNFDKTMYYILSEIATRSHIRIDSVCYYIEISGGTKILSLQDKSKNLQFDECIVRTLDSMGYDVKYVIEREQDQGNMVEKVIISWKGE